MMTRAVIVFPTKYELIPYEFPLTGTVTVAVTTVPVTVCESTVGLIET